MTRMRLSILGALVWLGAASTGNASPAATPPMSGTISVEIGAVEPNLTAASPSFVDAASHALAARGFTVIEGAGHARFVAVLTVTRMDVGTTTTKVPVERSSLATGGGVGVGASFSLSLPTGKTRSVPLQQTRLEVRIHERDAAADLWRGTAIAVRAADAGQEAKVASDLTETVLRIYPEQSESVASVP